jgi:hypothetical protein
VPVDLIVGLLYSYLHPHFGNPRNPILRVQRGTPRKPMKLEIARTQAFT